MLIALICFCLDGRAGVIPGFGTVRVTQGGAYAARAGDTTGVDSDRTGVEGLMDDVVGAGLACTEEMGLNTLEDGEVDPFEARGGMSG